MFEEQKLLIVQPEASSHAAALGQKLKALGLAASSRAADAKSALAIAESSPFDLALIFLVRDGPASAEVALADQLEKRCGLPTVFVVPTADDGGVAKRLGLPSFGFVRETAEPREWQLVIESTVGRSRAAREKHELARWLSRQLSGPEEGIIGTDGNGCIALMNTAAEVFTGWLRQEALGRPLAEVFRVVSENGRRSGGNLYEEAKAATLLVRMDTDRAIIRRDATEIGVQYAAAFLAETGGVVVTFRAGTDAARFKQARELIEAKMLESQRVESVGLLAGGIAHDFNNMLTAMIASVSLARLQLPAKTAANGPLDTIENAALRAAELCRQILAFTGRSKIGPQSLSLNVIAEEAVALLRPSVKNTLSFKWNPAPDLPTTVGDPVQLRQAVINLVRNAIEAMSDRVGTITIATQTAAIDRPGFRPFLFGETAVAGDFVALEVSDEGTGMSADTLEKIFDPFFTTKFTRRGLGLAATAGIVRAHRGALTVESQPGRGSKFRLFFPAERKAGALPSTEAPAVPAEALGENMPLILVADDDEAIRAFAKWVVERAGFRVVVTRDGDLALAEFTKNPEGFALVLLDLTMPRMSGSQVLNSIREINADVPVVFMTGYGEDAITENERAEVSGLLQKPFSPEALRDLLQRYAAPAKLAP